MVHCKRTKYDVYVGRPSPFGNPFKLASNASEAERAKLLETYCEWLRGRPDLIERARRELAGKVLGCWCSPKACHGDVLARVADGGDP